MLEFSITTKLNCPAWGLPIETCKTGKKLRRSSKLTVCKYCYCQIGPVSWPKSQERLERNFEDYFKDPERWIMKMSVKIEIAGCRFFRFFHSGDLQNIEMLQNICEVAKSLPYVKMWLPTIEERFVRSFLREGGKIPDNLNIRISSPLIDKPKISNLKGVTNSFVSLEVLNKGYECDGSCGPCQACWQKDIKLVSYPLRVGAVTRPKSVLKLLQ